MMSAEKMLRTAFSSAYSYTRRHTKPWGHRESGQPAQHSTWEKRGRTLGGLCSPSDHELGPSRRSPVFTGDSLCVSHEGPPRGCCPRQSSEKQTVNKTQRREQQKHKEDVLPVKKRGKLLLTRRTEQWTRKGLVEAMAFGVKKY